MGKTKIPAPDPRLYDALDKQNRQGDDMLAFVKQSYGDNQARLATQDKLNANVVNQQERLADNAESRSNDAYQFYQSAGKPLINQAIGDATGYDSDANRADARGRAGAAAQQGFDAAEGQQARQLASMGVNPNSGKFMALNNQLLAQKALGTAGASNSADEARRAQGVQMRLQAGNLASGMPAQAMGFAGQAGTMGSSASGIGQTNLSNAAGVQGMMTNGYSGAANIFGSGASGYNNAYNSELKGADMKSQEKGAMMGGLGQLGGTAMGAFMADGGAVRGPGSGISDSVPAVNTDNGQPVRLSNGEFVIPADVVRRKGSEFFQKLIDQHHVPAVMQRAGNLGRAAAHG